jgi:hypothetical protein
MVARDIIERVPAQPLLETGEFILKPLMLEEGLSHTVSLHDMMAIGEEIASMNDDIKPPIQPRKLTVSITYMESTHLEIPYKLI